MFPQNFVRKIPTHGIKCKASSCNVGIIPTSVGIVLIHVGIIPALPTHIMSCVGIFLTKCGKNNS